MGYIRGSRTCAALDVRLLQEKELALPSLLLLPLRVLPRVRSGCGSGTTSSENGLQIELSGECGVGSAQGSAAEELLDMVKVAIYGLGGRFPNNGIRLNHQVVGSGRINLKLLNQLGDAGKYLLRARETFDTATKYLSRSGWNSTRSSLNPCNVASPLAQFFLDKTWEMQRLCFYSSLIPIFPGSPLLASLSNERLPNQLVAETKFCLVVRNRIVRY